MTPERAVRRPTAAETAASSAARTLILAAALGLVTASAFLWAATPPGFYAMGWLSGCLSLGVVMLARKEGVI